MSNLSDAIVIGGGHNGLTASAVLAKAGLKVILLEQRPVLGGAAATEELWPGFKVNTGADDASLFHPRLVKELELAKHGLAFVESPVSLYAPQLEGPGLTLWSDVQKSQVEIAHFSAADAERWPAFASLVARLTAVLDQAMTLTPPDLADVPNMEQLPWAQLALQLRRMGGADMMEFMRVLPMPVAEWLDEWFTSDILKGALGAAGVRGNQLGPRAAGTAFNFLYNHLGQRNGRWQSLQLVQGGIGHLAEALASAARQQGAEIRTSAAVARIQVEDGRAIGVVLTNGEEIRGRVILSNADPRRTFFNLVDAAVLEPRFVRKLRAMRYRGCTAKVILALSGLPHFRDEGRRTEEFMSGRIVICPSLEYLERASDEAKYGRFSTSPYLDVVIPSLLDPSLAPPGQHVLSMMVQYAPYDLRDGRWEDQRELLGDTVVATLSKYAPDLPGLISQRKVITPLDWEQEYGLTEGSIHHGQMGLDQLLFMRPVAGYGRYRTPFSNLYLCGAGAHPGGGVTGLPGYNAAREVLRDWRKQFK